MAISPPPPHRMSPHGPWLDGVSEADNSERSSGLLPGQPRFLLLPADRVLIRSRKKMWPHTLRCSSHQRTRVLASAYLHVSGLRLGRPDTFTRRCTTQRHFTSLYSYECYLSGLPLDNHQDSGFCTV